jgi:ubiquinone/menaquinone biosynthesis C-methylase UbiE
MIIVITENVMINTSPTGLYFKAQSARINPATASDVKRYGIIISGKIPYAITGRNYKYLEKEKIYPPEVFRSLTKNMHILDIGTGDGSFISDLQKEGYQYARGIDIGHALPKDKPFLKQVSVADFKCPDNSLDRIFSSYSIFCYPESSAFRLAILKKMCNWLKPGGEIHLAALESTTELKQLIAQIPELRVGTEGKKDSYIQIIKRINRPTQASANTKSSLDINA